MLEKLEAINQRFIEIGAKINEPSIMKDMKRYIKLSKEYKELNAIVDAYKVYKNVLDNIESTQELLKTEKDDEFREMAKMELNELHEKKDTMEEDIRVMLIPEDPEDSKNAIVEIRAGAGGDEASIFAGDLYRMYLKFFEEKKWKFELVDVTEGTVGGFKEIIIEVKGEGVYGQMKY